MKVRLSKSGLRFEASIGATLSVLLLLALLTAAGIWQLQRAGYKAELVRQDRLAFEAPATPVGGILPDLEDAPFRRVILGGHYLSDRQFLLENRYRRQDDGVDQVGYEVITPFETHAGQVVLVNRGWIKADADRRVLPDVVIGVDVNHVEGTITAVDNGFTIGRMDGDDDWPRRILYINFDAIGMLLKMNIYPAVLMLAPGQPAALRADWRPIVIGPARHYGYAAQWFLMAAALLCCFGYFSIGRQRDVG